MDVLYFLKQRAQFVRKFYGSVSDQFLETKRKISKEEPPFDEYPEGFDPEWGEPPFLEEYQRSGVP